MACLEWYFDSGPICLCRFVKIEVAVIAGVPMGVGFGRSMVSHSIDKRIIQSSGRVDWSISGRGAYVNHCSRLELLMILLGMKTTLLSKEGLKLYQFIIYWSIKTEAMLISLETMEHCSSSTEPKS